ncbi:MAG: toll/interleukin-1 receptor domain-containing protein, partial [Clostridia bacterium]|nr:toll/interleukin-1 receptor domain-containing protein [Clostridia bacterium]
MSYDVFISYSHHNKAIADAICARLEQDGIRCWYAPRDIRPGEIWAESIINTIENVKVMVVVFTEDSNKSPQVLKEITNAVNAGVTIIPFKMTNEQPSKSLKYFFADVHWLDAVGAPLNSSIESLSQKVRSIINGENAAPPVKQAQPKPEKKSRLGLILAAVAVVAVLAVLGLLLKDRLSGGTPVPTAVPQTNMATDQVSATEPPAAATDNPTDIPATVTSVPTAIPTEVPTPTPTTVPTEILTPVPTATKEPTVAPTINPNNESYFYKPTGLAIISDGKQTFTAPASSLYTISASEITHGMKFLFNTGSDLPSFTKIASMEMTPHEDGNEYHRYFRVTLTDGSVMEEDVQTARSVLVFLTDSGKVTRD